MKWKLPQKTDWMKDQMAHEPTRTYAEDIYNLAGKFMPQKALEVGCMWGLSTLALLTGSECQLISVDKSDYTHADEEVRINNLKSRWSFICMDSADYWRQIDDHFDFIYIDGSHSYDYAHLDIQNGWKHLDEGGILAIDDATHKNNRPDSSDPYGVAIAAMEHWESNPTIKEAGLIGRILWFKK